MLKKILIALIILITITSTITTLKIASTEKQKKNTISKITNINNNNNNDNDNIKNNYQQDQIGNLSIKKINLNEPLFKINSPENTIEKHVSILKESILPNQENSIVFLAAHSGIGKIAYFEELDNLETNDEITLTLNNKTYTYIVKNTWEEIKNGYINVNKENKNQLILTTCSPTKDKYQLIVNCIEKEH